MAKKTKTKLEKLADKLGYKPRLAWDVMTQADKKAAQKFAAEYMRFMAAAKTERLAVIEMVALAKRAGFKDLARSKTVGRVFSVFRNKTVAVFVPGQKPLTEGLRLVAGHIDCPRIDLKARPVFEDADLAWLKTQYYGGIKKFQWLARPLALHGVVITSSGKTVRVSFGEKDNEPVLTIPDLLPHLARKIQGEKKLSEAIEGERMNVLIGGLPLGDKETKERFKLHVLNVLHDKYGITESDFVSAEFQLVPAGGPREVGLDGSMIGAYGHDDRVCAYTGLRTVLEVKKPTYGALALGLDKEEIGSEGASSARSWMLHRLVADLLRLTGIEPSYDNVTRTMMNVRALSADVDAAVDPNYPEVHEKYNNARMGYGVCLTRHTGHGGKYGASEADAEFVGWLRGVWDKAGVVWQPAVMGKVDEGGGGTVAKFLAQLGMRVVDTGTPVLGMHSPFEVIHKADLYQVYRSFDAFLAAE
ncbi:MAG: aminopeptidase [Proteobacteria bacterium]|nr:aminopeptidase [Pseudomonadota bacterium]MBU1740285.1 aminopeptidase [Pseudomonadota bacterium]